MSVESYEFSGDQFVAFAQPDSGFCTLYVWDHVEMVFRKFHNITCELPQKTASMEFPLCWTNVIWCLFFCLQLALLCTANQWWSPTVFTWLWLSCLVDLTSTSKDFISCSSSFLSQYWHQDFRGMVSSFFSHCCILQIILKAYHTDWKYAGETSLVGYTGNIYPTRLHLSPWHFIFHL